MGQVWKEGSLALLFSAWGQGNSNLSDKKNKGIAAGFGGPDEGGEWRTRERRIRVSRLFRRTGERALKVGKKKGQGIPGKEKIPSTSSLRGGS